MKYKSETHPINHSNKSSVPPLDCVTDDDPNAPDALPLFTPLPEFPHNPVNAFSFSRSLIDLPAAALAGLPVPDPSESDHRSSKFELGFAAGAAPPMDIVGFPIVVFAVVGNVTVRCTDVGFKGTPPNKLGASAGADPIIGLLEIGAPNMAGIC